MFVKKLESFMGLETSSWHLWDFREKQIVRDNRINGSSYSLFLSFSYKLSTNTDFLNSWNVFDRAGGF